MNKIKYKRLRNKIKRKAMHIKQIADRLGYENYEIIVPKIFYVDKQGNNPHTLYKIKNTSVLYSSKINFYGIIEYSINNGYISFKKLQIKDSPLGRALKGK